MAGTTRSNTRDGYELGDTPRLAPRPELKSLDRPGRWCPACGFELTMIDKPPCPNCERVFDPNNPSTTSAEPVVVEHNYWTDKQRVAGYAMLSLFLIGRGVINTVAPGWANALDGGTGVTQSARLAGALLALFIALLVIPWLVITTALGLVALGDYYNPKALYCYVFGAVLGVVLVLGMSPVLMLIGLIAGCFAGLVRAWLVKL